MLANPAYSQLAYIQLVVFGDSFSDSGNNAVVFGAERTPVPLTPPDIIPAAPYQSERYSNGPVWAEQLAEELGLGVVASLLGGTNYAYGGARVWQRVSPTESLSLPSQVAQYLSDTGGVAFSGSLYVIEGGGNDARDVLNALAAGEPGKAAKIIIEFKNNIGAMITKLSNAGATDFLIWNVPDVGLAPAVQAQGQIAILLATFVAKTMNVFLDRALDRLEHNLPIDIFRFDAFSFIDAVVANPQAFGFDNASDPCAVSPVCINDPGEHSFWDGLHPTTAGHGAIAQAVLQVLPNAVSAPNAVARTGEPQPAGARSALDGLARPSQAALLMSTVQSLTRHLTAPPEPR
ncbi:MAG: SGNH/GDSL hydrolase family protein [Nitrococcus sp.]|nr:SGNH/GDSL hydrolase family protein [Nitrococcus sp.]